MADTTILTQSPSRNEEDRREADIAARRASFEANGYQWNPATGTWQLKPKEKRPPLIAPSVSKQSLCLPDEDYSDAVCLLLPGGFATLIDVELFEFATRFDWQVLGRSIFSSESRPVTHNTRYCGKGKTGYGRYRVPATTTMHSLHRLLFSKGIEGRWDAYNLRREMARKDIDHENRNPWDNRCKNLRLATKSENAHNTAPRPNKSSKYKGVSKARSKDKWTAQIRVDGRLYYLGTFADEFTAAQAYNAAVRKHCPEFGYVNPLTISYDDL